MNYYDTLIEVADDCPAQKVDGRTAKPRRTRVVSASTPYAAHGRGDPQARIYWRRDGASWEP